MLRASRGVCVGGRPIGGIIVRAMLDYRTLPFIASRSPYLESLRPDRQVSDEDVSGRDVEFVVYGWSRAPLFASGTSVWTLPDAVFDRAVDSREAVLGRRSIADDERFRVYFLNDRGGIYALGYPVITALGHLINLAELVDAGRRAVRAADRRRPPSSTACPRARRPAVGRCCAKSARASTASCSSRSWRCRWCRWSSWRSPPGRTSPTNCTAGIEEAAARTATVAQRLVEDYATLQQRGTGGLDALDDDIMMLVSRAIDEDVNLFDRARPAGDERARPVRIAAAADAHAGRGLPPSGARARADLRRPSRMSAPCAICVAAAPVRTGGREGIVTVPVTLRQQEIEQQIDELDRRVLFGAVLFSLLGGALGYWMAERIADPVNRLTRATRRIARGDLDARIAATSADELGRLVHDFNQMAADLQRQRSELERTQRLEAWADMARQVAHDIKNPLTPIQLSAEHAQRVNIDRGRPLSPVLDECVTAILGQVRLLRQIAAEFSSFASSPTPQPEPTALPALHRRGRRRRTASGWPSGSRSTSNVPDELPPVTIDRTLFARALTNIIENALHAMPGNGRLTITAQPRRISPAPTPQPRSPQPPAPSPCWSGHRSHRHRRRHGRGSAGQDLRAVLLDQGDRHRPRADDREAECGAERRNDRGPRASAASARP